MIPHRCTPTILLSSAIALLAAPAAADAGTYDVTSCDTPGANRAWVFESNDSSHIEAGTACGTQQTYSGTYVRTRLGSAGGLSGAFGQWIFRAPTGTAITHVKMKRWLGMEAGSGWRPYGRQADGSILTGETCTAAAGTDECNVGGVYATPLDRSLSTTSIAYGIECTGVDLSCPTGATIHAGRAAIYSATVTITDPTAPDLTTPTGALVTESGYHRGIESASFAGSDTTGIKALRVYVDGVERAARAQACDYTYVVPCSNPSSAQTLNVDLAATSGGTRVIPDGTHTVQVASVDAAGNESRSIGRSIVVDATAPAAPSALISSAGSDWQTSRDFTATWTQPSGQVAPVDTAHWTICPPATTSGCTTGSAPVSESSGTLSGLQVPGEGAWDLSVRLEDAAGNTSTANVATTTVRYDATAPAASPNLGIAERAETSQAFRAYFSPPSGQSSPMAEALWTLCPQDSASGCTSGTLTAHPYDLNHLQASIPGYGDWILSVRLRDQAGNLGAAATTSLRYLAPVPGPAPAPTPATPSLTPTPPPSAPPAARVHARLRVASAVLDRSSRRLIVRGTAASTATGKVRVRVAVRRGARTRVLTRAVALAGGRFSVRLSLSRADSRRRIRVSAAYGGSRTHSDDRTPSESVRLR